LRLAQEHSSRKSDLLVDGTINVDSRWPTRTSQRAGKLLAIGKDNLVEMHQGLAVLGAIADRGDFVAGL
jgi:hypothetical protein